jgi:hypothetical protein
VSLTDYNRGSTSITQTVSDLEHRASIGEFGDDDDDDGVMKKGVARKAGFLSPLICLPVSLMLISYFCVQPKAYASEADLMLDLKESFTVGKLVDFTGSYNVREYPFFIPSISSF